MTPHVVLLQIGEVGIALPLEGVWHILPAPPIFPLALIRPGFRGVFLYQGQAVPSLDLPALLGLATGGKEAFTVIYGTDLGPLGLPVDQVLQIVDRQRGTVDTGEPSPPLLFPAKHRFIYNGTAYPLLDVEALLDTLPR